MKNVSPPTMPMLLGIFNSGDIPERGMEPTFAVPKRVLAEVANIVEPNAKDRSDSDDPNNDNCDIEKAILDSGPNIPSAISEK